MREKFFERRKFWRIPMVAVTRVCKEQGDPFQVVLIDISPGGAKIMTQSQVRAGERLSLRIPLHEEKSINVSGEIVWSKDLETSNEFRFQKEYISGIKFDKINEDVRKFIGRFTTK